MPPGSLPSPGSRGKIRLPFEDGDVFGHLTNGINNHKHTIYFIFPLKSHVMEREQHAQVLVAWKDANCMQVWCWQSPISHTACCSSSSSEECFLSSVKWCQWIVNPPSPCLPPVSPPLMPRRGSRSSPSPPTAATMQAAYLFNTTYYSHTA